MSKISDCIRGCGKRAGLIPFVTAGFPYADSTVDMLHALADAGADVIELGVPFSDPMADGAAIQRASEVALANGMTLARLLQQVSAFRRDNAKTPLVLMGYANSFLRFGDGFAAAAAEAGANGVLVVDLADADRSEWRRRLSAVGMDLVALVAPTTAPARMKKITAQAQGFVYFISLRGVTGAQHLQTSDIAAQAAQVREAAAAAGVPLAVGFGVREAAQARAVAAFADAVIIGSRLMEIADSAPQAAPQNVAAFVREMAEALQ